MNNNISSLVYKERWMSLPGEWQLSFNHELASQRVSSTGNALPLHSS